VYMFIFPSKAQPYCDIVLPQGKRMRKPFQAHTRIDSGLENLSIMINEVHKDAIVSRVVRPAEEGETGRLAARISAVNPNGTRQSAWVLPAKPAAVRTPEGLATVSLRPKTRRLPFALMLRDFRKTDYPGTDQPSSFESDVVVHDFTARMSTEHTISMNRPLDCAGWRIFQSSYIIDPHAGEASVFTIAKNPGTIWIYAGSAILILGMFLLFFGKKISNK